MRYFALLIGLMLSGPAAAHDWYPTECCGGQDCAPVDSASMVPTPDGGPMQMRVCTAVGCGVVPLNLSHFESKDNRMHACLVRGAAFGAYVRCIWDPPTN